MFSLKVGYGLGRIKSGRLKIWASMQHMCSGTILEFEHRSGGREGLRGFLQLDPCARYAILGWVERLEVEPERPVNYLCLGPCKQAYL